MRMLKRYDAMFAAKFRGSCCLNERPDAVVSVRKPSPADDLSYASSLFE